MWLKSNFLLLQKRESNTNAVYIAAAVSLYKKGTKKKAARCASEKFLSSTKFCTTFKLHKNAARVLSNIFITTVCFIIKVIIQHKKPLLHWNWSTLSQKKGRWYIYYYCNLPHILSIYMFKLFLGWCLAEKGEYFFGSGIKSLCQQKRVFYLQHLSPFKPSRFLICYFLTLYNKLCMSATFLQALAYCHVTKRENAGPLPTCTYILMQTVFWDGFFFMKKNCQAPPLSATDFFLPRLLVQWLLNTLLLR